MDYSYSRAVLYDPSEVGQRCCDRVLDPTQLAYCDAHNPNRPSPLAPYSLQVYTSAFTTPFLVDAGEGTSLVRIPVPCTF